ERIPLAHPEGDAGTGMVATNAVKVGRGNVSAGTSDFAMVVLGHMPSRHREIDLVTTPWGDPVAMVHCNNCTSDINYWISLFGEFAERAGFPLSPDKLYSLLYSAPLEAEGDPSALLSCNYYSGEGVTDFGRGIPVFLHSPSSSPSLPDFMKCHMYSALATLKIGMDILGEEGIRIESMLAHGGFFKSGESGLRMLSAAIASPVSAMESAGEGGAYGMAVLSLFLISSKGRDLSSYLDEEVFEKAEVRTVNASEKEVEDYRKYIESYRRLLEVERKILEMF
ncbi:MAG: FGGY-family carbohydrate kinase, partial [Candidatus Ornithospirochaeta sp.]